VLKLCVSLLFRFVLSYGIVGKPSAYTYNSSLTPVLNLVCYVSLCEGLRAGAGSLCYYRTRL